MDVNYIDDGRAFLSHIMIPAVGFEMYDMADFVNTFFQIDLSDLKQVLKFQSQTMEISFMQEQNILRMKELPRGMTFSCQPILEESTSGVQMPNLNFQYGLNIPCDRLKRAVEALTTLSPDIEILLINEDSTGIFRLFAKKETQEMTDDIDLSSPIPELPDVGIGSTYSSAYLSKITKTGVLLSNTVKLSISDSYPLKFYYKEEENNVIKMEIVQMLAPRIMEQ